MAARSIEASGIGLWSIDIVEMAGVAPGADLACWSTAPCVVGAGVAALAPVLTGTRIVFLVFVLLARTRASGICMVMPKPCCAAAAWGRHSAAALAASSIDRVIV
ncbi:hypothetical protein [Sphingomonas sp. PP-F2F-G114-C0414]|uniref:hypothetical protein n=1 Tax=Sphingomonas sp. PP-F2F-G114-C0414 TaxID=2135662 RepID=UPI00217CFF3A|nr:hypothetical protein [Sphingomonas sp. PP-F2F-G114-C0414]